MALDSPVAINVSYKTRSPVGPLTHWRSRCRLSQGALTFSRSYSRIFPKNAPEQPVFRDKQIAWLPELLGNARATSFFLFPYGQEKATNRCFIFYHSTNVSYHDAPPRRRNFTSNLFVGDAFSSPCDRRFGSRELSLIIANFCTSISRLRQRRFCSAIGGADSCWPRRDGNF